jgi:eukaryotic-like serine/threonine-protein kinase
MALNPADITVVSRLLDEALALPLAERSAWLNGLPAEHLRHADTLRGMLEQADGLASDPMLDGLPHIGPDASVAQAQELVGPYRLLREIGHGGMGSVWLAERADGAFKRQVALKLPRLAWGAGLAERMAREREIGMLLEHPNIARLYDAGVDEHGRPYLALEFVDGQPIDVWCDAQGLNVRDRLRLFLQVAKAVAYAHGRLVVHRDLKPLNVLVTADGQAHLLDFGIAKLLSDVALNEPALTQQGQVLTPHYASPEQVAGEPITVQSDVYSLGVLLYELLTGTLPIAPKRSTLGAVEDAILEGDALPASSRVKDSVRVKALRGEVDAILAKAMQREPARRYATADGLSMDIERHLNGETVTARPDSVGYRLRKAVRRHWVGVAAMGAVLAAVLAAGSVAVVQASRASNEAERARVVKQFIVDVFKLNSPDSVSNAQLRKLPAEMLLDHGARSIEKRFAGQPSLQAELYGVVGGIFSDMGVPVVAADYATRQVATLTSIKASDVEQAQALFLLAKTFYDQKRDQDAEITARRAISLAKFDLDLELRAKVLRARTLHRLGQVEGARRELVSVEHSLLQLPPIPSAARAGALELRASFLEGDNRFDEALKASSDAIAEAVAAEGALSRTAIDIRLKLANGLFSRNRDKEARLQSEAALAALRELGGANEIRAAMEESRFARKAYEMGASKFEDARLTIERVQSLISGRGQMVPDSVLARIEMDLGLVLFHFGKVEQGDRLIDPAATRLQLGTSALGERWWVVAWHGAAAMDAGRHVEADMLLRERLALRKQMGQGSVPFAAYDYVYVAINLGMLGRPKEGLGVLAAAPSFEVERGDAASGGAYPEAIKWAQAQLMLDSGDPLAALKLIPEGAEKPVYELDRIDVTETGLVFGEALCASGQREKGLGILLARIANVAPNTYPHAPRLAYARAVAGHCALLAGLRPLAQQLAALSRAAFTAQPGVSPYFKAPLTKLERALGHKLPPV